MASNTSSSTSVPTDTTATSNGIADKSNYVILDCDGGSDDAWALLLLLKAEKEQRVVLLGITICGCGNTNSHNAARNILRILRASGREEIPIFLGAAEPIIPFHGTHDPSVTPFHGKDGFGDILPVEESLMNIGALVRRQSAVEAINQLCSEHPQKVTIIAVGPLTNIALCYAVYGAEFKNNVKDLFIMGGNYQGVGNFSRTAEFNFYSDPEAAHIVLEKSKCPITILPWEPCMYDNFFICINWRLDTFGPQAVATCPAIEILNKVEHAQWIPSGFKGWNPCDAMLVGAYLFGNQFIRKQSMWHATVDIGGRLTRGQMVLDHLHLEEKYPKRVRIIENVDTEYFKKIAEWAVGLREMKVQLGMGSNEVEKEIMTIYPSC